MMRVSSSVRLRRQVRFLKRQFLQNGELPFTDILSAQAISEALSTAEIVWKDRIYPPLVTLWVFLSQVLAQTIRVVLQLPVLSLIGFREEKASALRIPAVSSILHCKRVEKRQFCPTKLVV